MHLGSIHHAGFVYKRTLPTMLRFTRLRSSCSIFLLCKYFRAYVEPPPCGRLIHYSCVPIRGAHENIRQRNGKGRLAMPYSQMTRATNLGITGLNRILELEKRSVHPFLLNNTTMQPKDIHFFNLVIGGRSDEALRELLESPNREKWHDDYCGSS